MATSGLDRVLMEYERAAQIHSAFEEQYGALAASYLSHLPWLFRLFRRSPFDATLPLRARHAAAVVAFYLAEDQDFFAPNAANGPAPSSRGEWGGGSALSEVDHDVIPATGQISSADSGLIDDVFAAYFGLNALIEIVGDADLLRPHWRSTDAFAIVVGLSKNLGPLRDECPSKVLERVEALLRMPK